MTFYGLMNSQPAVPPDYILKDVLMSPDVTLYVTGLLDV